MKKNRLREYFNSELMTRLFMPVTTILVSLVCFTLTTWAWFTASYSKGVDAIHTSVDVTVNVYQLEEGNNTTEIIPSEHGYQLAAGKSYQILYSVGDAKNGYYSILTFSDGTTRYTPCMKQTETVNKFNFQVHEETTLVIQNKWARPGENIYEEGTVNDDVILTSDPFMIGETQSVNALENSEQPENHHEEAVQTVQPQQYENSTELTEGVQEQQLQPDEPSSSTEGSEISEQNVEATEVKENPSEQAVTENQTPEETGDLYAIESQSVTEESDTVDSDAVNSVDQNETENTEE